MFANTLVFKFVGKEYKKSKGLEIPIFFKFKTVFEPIPFKFSSDPNNGNKNLGLIIFKN